MARARGLDTKVTWQDGNDQDGLLALAVIPFRRLCGSIVTATSKSSAELASDGFRRPGGDGDR